MSTCLHCARKHKAKGLCGEHYRRLTLYGHPLAQKRKVYELNGEQKTITDWARHIGISQASLSERFKRGWPIDLALTTPRLKQGGDRSRGIAAHVQVTPAAQRV